jgi:hypothetical protein
VDAAVRRDDHLTPPSGQFDYLRNVTKNVTFAY